MTLTLTRAGTRLPGAVGRLHLYHGHASGLCHLGVFPHVSGGAFQNAPVAIFVHGEGLGCEPGRGSSSPWQGPRTQGRLRSRPASWQTCS
jgi:hypothetical protein